MKKNLAILWGLLLLSLAVLLFAAGKAHAAGGPTSAIQFSVTNTSATVPIALSTTRRYAQSFTVIGSVAPQVNNVGNIYIGTLTNNTQQPILVQPGTMISVIAPPGEWINLQEWFLDVVNANDGVTIIYTP